MFKSILAVVLACAVVVSAQAGGGLGLGLGLGLGSSAKWTAGQAMALPAMNLVPAALNLNKQAAPLAFTSVKSAQMNAPQTLGVIELSPIMQPYSVPSTTVVQENIKQPITQPVLQPYLQRYVQQAQPIVQPIVNRVVQPVIHRELRPFLQSSTEQGPAAFTVTQPTQYTMRYNEAIVGTDLPSQPMANLGKSVAAAPQFVQLPAAQKSHRF